MIKHFSEIPFTKDIAIFCDGTSMHKSHPVLMDNLVGISTIGINQFSCKPVDYRFFNDTHVEWLMDGKRGEKYISKYLNSSYYDLDYEYTRDDQKGMQENFSLYSLLYLLTKYFPDRNVYLFGVDLNENTRRRYIIDGTVIEEVVPSYTDGLLRLRESLKIFSGDNFFNVNEESGLDTMKKIRYEEIQWRK